MPKKAFNIEFELYKLLSNQLREIDIDLLSDCIKISKKTCLRYSRKPTLPDEIIEKQSNNEDDEMEDWNDEDCRIHTSGYKSFNQQKHFIPHLSKQDLKSFKSEVFENAEISKDVKDKLLKLLGYNLLTINKYGDAIEKILYCIENKKYLEVEEQYEPNKTRGKMYLSPVYVDLDKSELYAVKGGENLLKMNIHSIQGLEATDYDLPFHDSFDSYFDGIVGLSISNSKINDFEIEDNDIIDSFGSPYIERESVFYIRMLLDNYAKSELMRENIFLEKYIKRYKYKEFSHVLVTAVYNLAPVFDFIIRFNSHTLLLGDKNTKKKLVTHIGEVVNNLNDLQNRLTNKKS